MSDSRGRPGLHKRPPRPKKKGSNISASSINEHALNVSEEKDNIDSSATMDSPLSSSTPAADGLTEVRLNRAFSQPAEPEMVLRGDTAGRDESPEGWNHSAVIRRHTHHSQHTPGSRR